MVELAIFEGSYIDERIGGHVQGHGLEEGA